ncbi:bifunctional 2-polyprenyl-6-hydroxyphenol methylase/3-demethylubiquinol 3-O-methyltransferase UbiG [Kineosporia mesophila]|uniref:Bifunctional 2-polyprenyl-6-hydroxyphenol methylase/3-demethylubiquinol 3-O-methyltransferase UbiG n=1 Tax=Kineosporia mesophila TaxID=566012 RepID=A0ABP6ZQJ1_9ACTN|nr:methyltransferase domain-containing protein [Kineosporia mesophila]MCD5349853.1 methyltransferase domain-containing protein [Kineosporia mesophila]
MSSRRARNDPAQYDDLTDEWWRPHGRFAALHWLARSRAGLIPDPPREGAPLLDIACGAGLLQPHLTGRLSGWAHTGIDLSLLSLRQARVRGVRVLAADATRLPFADHTFECVVAGEVLEHLTDLPAAVAEISRVLAPGGTLVVDTLNDTLLCRVALVRIAERLPGGPPPGIHDPDLLVPPERLGELLARHGVRLRPPTGLRPAVGEYLAWLTRRRDDVTMLPTRSVATVYQATAIKESV